MFLEWGKNINGRNIKGIMLDDGCDPIKGIAATKKLIFEDKVFMICGGQCSNQMLAVKPVVEQAGIPYLVVGAVADSICIPVVKNIFHPAVVSTTLAQTMADFAMTVPGVKKLGIIRHTDEWAQSIYGPLVEYLKTQYKRTLDVEVTAERGTGDLNAQVLKLKQEKVDCLINILFPAETTALLRAAYNLGLDVPIVSNPASPASEQYESLRMIGPVKKYFGLWSLNIL